MTMCSRCHKRVAVVFMTKIENGETKQEGICLKCARELGIKPVNDMISKMGLTDEDIDRMSSEIENFMEDGGEDMLGQIMGSMGGENLPSEIPSDDEADSRAPAMDFSKLMGGSSADEGKKGKKKKKETKFLTTYCTNMTERAAMGKMDNVVGRDRELARVIQILCRRQKNNPCLIGEPGVGKTAIAEALAQKIVKGEVPYALKNKEVYLVDLTALVAGTQFRGQFESRVLGLLGEVKALGNVILVIDEVHNIVGAGDAEGSMNAANILKPALSRGEIQVIGATTLTEYRKYIEKDTALERRFQPVTVDEPGMEDTENILKGIKHYYEEYHSITIPNTVLSYAVSLSERYITDRYLPDKAIDLIDEAASHISLSSPEINEKRECLDTIKVLENEKGRLEAAAEKGENTEDTYRRLAEVKSETLSLKAKVEELTPLCDKVEMTVSDLADVIEIWTGIPASTINEDEFSRLEGLAGRIKKRIVGQDKAVDAVVRAVKRGRTGISPKRKPVSFIFAGPTGVGKTELVKVLAEDLFSSPETLIRLDMSEFMDKFSVSRIIGAPPGYVGYDDAGQLTEKIRRKPYSVVLFDEIEKAHPDVMNILLQILDDGRITDAHGKQVSFENTVIVMTTNAGSMDGSLLSGFTDKPELMSEEKTHKALSTFLRPEFINRVDEVITFRSLSEENFSGIARIMISDLEKVMKEKEIVLTVSEAAVEYVAKRSFSVKYGARNMRRFIETEIQDKIAEEIIRTRGRLKAVNVDADENGILVTSI